MIDLELLQQLTKALAPSSNEINVAQLVHDYLKPYTNTIYTDTIGNTIAIANPDEKKTILLSAHADEVGFQVIGYSEDGLLITRCIGGIKPMSTSRQRVCLLLKGRRMQAELIARQDYKTKESLGNCNTYFIDIGVSSRNSASQIVPIGALATFMPNYQQEDNRIRSKSLDDRVGIYIICNTFMQLANKIKNIRLIVAATAQEEIGLRGMAAVASKIQPDICINYDVVDGCDQYNGINPIIGHGPALVNNADSTPSLILQLSHIADTSLIPYQIFAGQTFTGGNDASRMQIFSPQTSVINIGIPCHGIHSQTEECAVDDIISSIKIASAFIQHIDYNGILSYSK